MSFDAGYSKTPLHRKLGCRPERPIFLLAPPDGFAAYLREHGFEVLVVDDVGDVPQGVGHVHLFGTEAAAVTAAMRALSDRVARDGQVWLSWPKKASKLPCDIDKGLLHRKGAFGDFVDVKVCAVDATWSALKYVIRKDRR